MLDTPPQDTLSYKHLYVFSVNLWVVLHNDDDDDDDDDGRQ